MKKKIIISVLFAAAVFSAVSCKIKDRDAVINKTGFAYSVYQDIRNKVEKQVSALDYAVKLNEYIDAPIQEKKAISYGYFGADTIKKDQNGYVLSYMCKINTNSYPLNSFGSKWDVIYGKYEGGSETIQYLQEGKWQIMIPENDSPEYKPVFNNEFVLIPERESDETVSSFLYKVEGGCVLKDNSKYFKGKVCSLVLKIKEPLIFGVSRKRGYDDIKRILGGEFSGELKDSVTGEHITSFEISIYYSSSHRTVVTITQDGVRESY